MHPIRWLTRGLAWGSLGVVGGAAVVTIRHLLVTPQPLESTLTSEGQTDRRREGEIYYNVAGPAAALPLVLLHDFYPGASNYEFRRVFPRLAASYRVYAPDWLGFGLSERPALAYTGEFYAHLLSGFLRDTVQRPAVVVAHGLAANIAVRAASDEPALFDRLVLLAPQTLAGTESGPSVAQSLVRVAQRSSLGLVPYATLATRLALRWQMRRRAVEPGVGGASDDVLDHLYASAHQFGGHHALLALLTGELDLPIQNAFALLEPPVLVVGGEGDAIQPPLYLEDLTLLNPHAKLVIVPGAGNAVAEDEPAALVEHVSAWLQMPIERHPPTPIETSWGLDESPDLESLPEDPIEEVGLLDDMSYGEIFEEEAADIDIVEWQDAAGAEEVFYGEQLGDSPGLMTPPPGLEDLEGLAEQAPESARDVEPRDATAAAPDASPAPSRAEPAEPAPGGPTRPEPALADEQFLAREAESTTTADPPAATPPPPEAQPRPEQAMRQGTHRDSVRTERRRGGAPETPGYVAPAGDKGAQSASGDPARGNAGASRVSRSGSDTPSRKPPTHKGKPQQP